MTLRLWLAARGAAMGFLMMPSMTAGLNAIPLAQMSRGSAISNVMRQVFGAFGTAIVVTILQQRQAFHTAMLSQLVTPENLPLQQVLSSTQAWALGHGMSAAQAQVMGLMMVGRQVAVSASVMSYDDVFRITAAVTLLAILPALFLKTRRTARGGPGAASVMMD
jgi:DHA2 family multidrug resistance protein